MRVFLVGGGTGGPTSPVLAVAKALKEQKPSLELFFVGYDKSIEQRLIGASEVKFEEYFTIPAGKWRRYFSLWNLIDLFRIFAGFIKALFLLRKYKPDIVFGAGSFVQVPVMWAAYFLGIKVVAHQQDWRVILSTRLVFPVATAITTAIEGSQKDFSTSSGLFSGLRKSKIHWTGNPTRSEVLNGSQDRARDYFSLSDKYPTVFFMGGGTGSKSLNKVLEEALPELVKYVQIIHVSGSGKTIEYSHENYHQYDFLEKEIGDAYAVADLVVCRAGMSTITELSVLGKASVLIPLPESPQEDNAKLLAFLKAAIGINEEILSSELLIKMVRKILWDQELQDGLQNNIKNLMPENADEKIAKIILKELQ